MRNTQDLQLAVEDGAVKRIRPKTMTVMAIPSGLLPIMWSHGAGADHETHRSADGGWRHVLRSRAFRLSRHFHGLEGVARSEAGHGSRRERASGWRLSMQPPSRSAQALRRTIAGTQALREHLPDEMRDLGIERNQAGFT